MDYLLTLGFNTNQNLSNSGDRFELVTSLVYMVDIIYDQNLVMFKFRGGNAEGLKSQKLFILEKIDTESKIV